MSTDIVRSFGQFLAEAENGQLHTDLSTALQDLVAALSDAAANTGGKPRGKLTLTLDFRIDGGVVEVNAEHKITRPKQVRARSIFWATPENHLTRLNPRQRELPLRDVTPEHREII